MTWLSAFEQLGSELSSFAANVSRSLPVWCGYGGFAAGAERAVSDGYP